MQSEIATETWTGLEPGDVVAGKYRVTRIIGRGGIGIVAEAVHQTDEHRVAIKVLRPSPDGQAEATARFLFEAKAAAQMKSVHVARVLEVSTLAHGAPYFIMEYLEGHDLEAALKGEGVLTVEAAVDYALQTCEALAEAHSGGIFHGNLKPSNLFLTATAGGTVLVKLLDFGISKQIPMGGADVQSTKTHWPAMGTPFYIAPEQMRGTRRVDHRADIWALGIILHESLTAQMPFAGTTLLQMSAAIAADPPVRARSQRPDLPEELEEIIVRCLQKEPEDRFANVGELASALLPFGPANAALTEKRIATVLARATNVTAPPPPPSGPPPSIPVPILKTPYLQLLPTVPTMMVQSLPEDVGSRVTTVPMDPSDAPNASSVPVSSQPESLPATKPTGAAQLESLALTTKLAGPSDAAAKPSEASAPGVEAFTAPLPPDDALGVDDAPRSASRSRAPLWIGLVAVVVVAGVAFRVVKTGSMSLGIDTSRLETRLGIRGAEPRPSAEPSPAPRVADSAAVAPAVHRPASAPPAPEPSQAAEVASVTPPPVASTPKPTRSHRHSAPPPASDPATASSASAPAPSGTADFGGSRE